MYMHRHTDADAHNTHTRMISQRWMRSAMTAGCPRGPVNGGHVL